MYSVYIVKPGNVRGRYLRYRTVLLREGKYHHDLDFVRNKDDATLFLRFEDARSKALELKSIQKDPEVYVAEIIPGEKLGKVHPVKEKP